MMIRRNLGLTFEDSCRIARRKSTWMVLYLRARRTGDFCRGFYRRQHFEERQR